MLTSLGASLSLFSYHPSNSFTINYLFKHEIYIFFSPPQIDMSISRKRIQQLLSEPTRSASTICISSTALVQPDIAPTDDTQFQSRDYPYSYLIGRRNTSYTPCKVPTLADLHLQSQEQLHRSALEYQVKPKC